MRRAALLLVLALTGCTDSSSQTAGTVSPSVSSTASTAASTASSSPAATKRTAPYRGSIVSDATWLDADRGWVAAEHPCVDKVRPVVRACVSILATSDAGTSWDRRHEEQAVAGETEWPGVSIAFVDDRHGWLAIAGRLLSTTDGGRTWTRETTVRHARSVTPSHGGVIVRVATGPQPTREDACACQLLRAATGSHAFTKTLTLPQDVYVVSGAGELAYAFTEIGQRLEKEVYRSTNGGHTWVRTADPCHTDGLDGDTRGISINGETVAFSCTGSYSPNGYGHRLSTDGGATFGPGIGSACEEGPVEIFDATWALCTTYVGAGVLTSSDGGKGWRVTVSGNTGSDDLATYLAVANKTSAHYIGDNTVWTTRDRGKTWTTSSF